MGERENKREIKGERVRESVCGRESEKECVRERENKEREWERV